MIVAPSPAPCTVTLADPLDGTFSLVITLKVAVSEEYDSEVLPTCPPNVTAIRKLPPA
jgi:hypothetical protein